MLVLGTLAVFGEVTVLDRMTVWGKVTVLGMHFVGNAILGVVREASWRWIPF
jgi:hypothetical protein